MVAMIASVAEREYEFKLFVIVHVQILDKEAVKAANQEKVIPDIRPGDVIQLRVVSCFF